jgi:hypothetical protein
MIFEGFWAFLVASHPFHWSFFWAFFNDFCMRQMAWSRNKKPFWGV